MPWASFLVFNNVPFQLQIQEKRRGWDSNPRDGLTPPTRFPVALLRPTRTPLQSVREQVYQIAAAGKASEKCAFWTALCRHRDKLSGIEGGSHRDREKYAVRTEDRPLRDGRHRTFKA